MLCGTRQGGEEAGWAPLTLCWNVVEGVVVHSLVSTRHSTLEEAQRHPSALLFYRSRDRDVLPPWQAVLILVIAHA